MIVVVRYGLLMSGVVLSWTLAFTRLMFSIESKQLSTIIDTESDPLNRGLDLTDS